MNKEKYTIFGEEHFIDNTMIEFIEIKNNVIDNMVFDEMEKSIRITLPFVKINAEKLRKWVNLCMQLENIEHSELINIAIKKKILDLQSELEVYKKALRLASKSVLYPYCNRWIEFESLLSETIECFLNQARKELENDKN